ncbi:MAG: polysaccharide pyruvyl transferase family protein [Ruminococcaceae bacterium]|nr:polysaccharide pyruvyl transferase family protein [Oscillospiraceae bacterium]
MRWNMKTKIITIHGIPNFGSIFQSYALCEYLKAKGFGDVELIDYNPPYYNKKTLRSLAGKALNFRHYLKRKRKYRAFVERELPLTEKSYSSIAELNSAELPADLYLAGGDQLWNVYHNCGKDDAYKLTWAKGRKASYATSMGQTGFTKEQLSALGEKISDFEAVSVRESSSVDMLSSVGITAEHSVDPVYLLDPSHYERFVKPVNQPDYLLVYLVNPSKLLDDCIEFLSKKYGLKVILCSGFRRKCKCDEFLKDLGPDEMLSYIKGAKIVLSSSFHATSFSLIFKKQFFTILPDEHTNERIVDLLKIMKLESRIITEKSDLPAALSADIDYSGFSDYAEHINESKAYLNRIINNDK